MKIIFSSPLVTTLFILYVLLFIWLVVFMPRYFDLPIWSKFWLFVVGLWFVREIPSRFGPKKLETPLSFVWEASTRDRVLFLVSLTGIVILNFTEGFYLKQINPWLGLLISILDILLFTVIINLFGSAEFRQTFNKRLMRW